MSQFNFKIVIEEKKAMKAIHRLLHQGRSLAFEGMVNKQLALYFDEFDYLMGLVIAWSDDRSQQFEDGLIGVCEKYSCNHIAAEFTKI